MWKENLSFSVLVHIPQGSSGVVVSCALMKLRGTALPSAINSLQVEPNISECEAPSKTHWLRAAVSQLRVINSLLYSTIDSLSACVAQLGVRCLWCWDWKPLSSMPLRTCSHLFSRDPITKHAPLYTWHLTVFPVTTCDRISYIISTRGRASFTFITAAAFVFGQKTRTFVSCFECFVCVVYTLILNIA